MFTVLSAGLPSSAKDILSKAMEEAFDGAVEIQELTKENLKSRVRLSMRSVSIILVILDKVSSDICSGIENGLYNSDKYFTYTTDKSLADFLNSKYNLDIVVEDGGDVSLEDLKLGVGDTDIHLEYQEKLRFKDDIIKSLEARIRHLSSFYGEDEDFETIGEVKFQKDELSKELLDVKSALSLREKEGKELNSVISEQKDYISSIELKLTNLSKEYESVLKELNELKVLYTKQTGVLRDKDSKIADLDKKIEAYEKDFSKIAEMEDLVSRYKNSIAEKDKNISNLKNDLDTKDRDLSVVLKELEGLRNLRGIEEKLDLANETISSLKDELGIVTGERDELKKKSNNFNVSISSLEEDISGYKQKLEELDTENRELKSRVKSDSESLAILNQEKIDLQEKIGILERSVDSDNSSEELLREIQDLQNRLASINSNIFSRIGSMVLPNSPVGGKVLSGTGRFSNIRFAFSGNAESRRGAYKCLLEEIKKSSGDDKYLIVDLVSETSIDYVFEVKRRVPGVDWFRKGGNVHPFISDTLLDNTKILLVSVGYINDSYFLSIDWSKRLVELERSGYKVILYCGDLSNIVGRVLYESFASYGETIVYVCGNTTGSRTIVTNLIGLSNSKDSVIAYYDYNPAVKSFYDKVDKTNECRILSLKKNTRR